MSNISVLKLQKVHWGSKCFVQYGVTQTYFISEYLFHVPLDNCKIYFGITQFNLSSVF